MSHIAIEMMYSQDQMVDQISTNQTETETKG